MTKTIDFLTGLEENTNPVIDKINTIITHLLERIGPQYDEENAIDSDELYLFLQTLLVLLQKYEEQQNVSDATKNFKKLINDVICNMNSYKTNDRKQYAFLAIALLFVAGGLVGIPLIATMASAAVYYLVVGIDILCTIFATYKMSQARVEKVRISQGLEITIKEATEAKENNGQDAISILSHSSSFQRVNFFNKLHNTIDAARDPYPSRSVNGDLLFS